MDSKTKRKNAESVRRDFSRRIARSGFTRSKPSFWTRGDELIAQFIHLHLFSFAPSFRVHLGVRVLCSRFDAAALNGPSSYDGWALGTRRYVFDFSDSPESKTRCTDDLAAFVVDVAIPWFERFRSPPALLEPDSPLDDDSRRCLRAALAGEHDEAAISASQAILGLPA